MNNILAIAEQTPFICLEFHTLPSLVLPSQTSWTDAKPNDLRWLHPFCQNRCPNSWTPGVPGRYQSERPIGSEVLLKQLTSLCLGSVDIAWTTTRAINLSTYTTQTASSRDGRKQDN